MSTTTAHRRVLDAITGGHYPGGVAAVVLLALDATRDEANGRESAERATAFRHAASVATGHNLGQHSFIEAVRYEMGL